MHLQLACSCIKFVNPDGVSKKFHSTSQSKLNRAFGPQVPPTVSVFSAQQHRFGCDCYQLHLQVIRRRWLQLPSPETFHRTAGNRYHERDRKTSERENQRRRARLLSAVFELYSTFADECESIFQECEEIRSHRGSPCQHIATRLQRFRPSPHA